MVLKINDSLFFNANFYQCRTATSHYPASTGQAQRGQVRRINTRFLCAVLILPSCPFFSFPFFTLFHNRVSWSLRLAAGKAKVVPKPMTIVIGLGTT
jgi:hypothetical protein